MIFDLIGASPIYILIELLVIVPIILFSLTFHEYAHAFVANKLGDPTAKLQGRLTLNPFKHLDPIGAILMLVVGIGYAKPVMINARYFKNPKKGMALSALAGPSMNLIISFTAVVLGSVFGRFLYDQLPETFALAFDLFFYYLAYLNAYLAIFNLLPIPPFDGSRIAMVILPDRIYFGIMKYERIIMIVTFAVILGLSRINLNPFSWLAQLFINGVSSLINLILP